jgi:hypothetical protein
MIRDVQLWIDGKYIDLNVENIRLNSVTPWIKDEVPSFLFTQESMHVIAEDPWINKTVCLWIDDGETNSGYTPPNPLAPITTMPDPVSKPWWRLIFLGQCHRRTSTNGDMGWVYGYEAFGLDYLASQWPIISPFDGTGSVTFNLPATDPNYDETTSGLTMAKILLMMLEEPITAKHFDDLARLVNPGDNRYTGAALGKYAFTTPAGTIDPTNPANGWRIDQRTRDDLLNDPYLGETIVNGAAVSYPPTVPVTFNGDDWLQGIRAVLQAIAPNHTMWVEPVYEQLPGAAASDPKRPIGIIRFANTAKLWQNVKRDPSKKVELLVHENPLPNIQRNYQNSFSRLVIRGGPNIVGYELRMSRGDFAEDFAVTPYATNEAAKADWKLSTITPPLKTQKFNLTGLCRRPRLPNEMASTIPDPNTPNGTLPNPSYVASDTDPKLASSTFFYVTSATEQITTTAANGTVTVANQPASWSAHLLAQNSAALGGTISITRRNQAPQTGNLTETRGVLDNERLLVGGTSHVYLSASLQYNDHFAGTLTTSKPPGWATYRRYKILKTLPNGVNVAKRVQAKFPAYTAWLDDAKGMISDNISSGASMAFLTTTSGGNVTTESRQMPGFQVDRLTEDIIFNLPLCTLFTSQANQTLGGSNVTLPSDVWVYIPVSMGSLETTVPKNAGNMPVYRGTCYTEDKLERTKYINDPQWVSSGDTDVLYQWGDQLLSGMEDTIVEGHVPLLKYKCYIGWGWWIRWTDNCPGEGTPLALNRMESDIRGVTITWNHGNAVVPIMTDITVSNRRDPYAAQTPIVYHPAVYPQRAASEYKIDWFDPMSALPRANTNAIEDKRAMDLATKTWDVDPNEASRLRAAGLDFMQTAPQLGAEAAQLSAIEAEKATLNAARAAQDGTLQGDGQGWSGAFHTADGNIPTGMGMDGKDYRAKGSN